MLQMLIRNGACVNPSGAFHADIAISEGTIVAIGRKLDLPAETTIDASDKLVLPGLVDAHVHMPWPSGDLDSVDDLDAGTTSAVCGGVTSVVEYVVPDESGRILPSLDARLKQVAGATHCDYGAHLILRKVTAETLDEMAIACERGFTSFKIYTAYEGFCLSDTEMLQAMDRARQLDAVVCFHAEDGALVTFATSRLVQAGKTGIDRYPEAHPQAADVSGTSRVLNYARYTGARVHIVHVNTGAGVELVRRARESGVAVTAETCPHYLMFADDAYRTGKPEAHHYVVAPAIRTEADRDGLWSALSNGHLHSIATDHAPYTSEQKLRGVGDFRAVPGGISGVETSLPLLYSYGVRAGRFPIERLVGLMSTSPAKIFGLFPRKGILAVGSDADLIIYDESGRSAITHSRPHSRTDHSLYEGVEVLGRLSKTILGGQVIVQDGEMVAPGPAGRVLHRAAGDQRGA